MALIKEYTHGDSYLHINSDGWSGNIINISSVDDDDRKFQFDIDFSLENGRYGTSWVRTDENSYGLVTRNAQNPNSVVGVSLEHMGDGWFDGRYSQQFLGTHTDGSMGYNYLYPCFGASWSSQEEEPSALNLTSDIMNLQNYNYYSAYSQATGVRSSYFKTIYCDPNCNPINQYVGWIIGNYHSEITTDLPLFETDADLLDWCKDPTNPDTLSKMLNYTSPVPPEEEYEEQFKFWYIKNKWGHNTRNVDSSNNNTKNYRFYPKRRGICFIKHTPTASEPYDRILYNYSGYEPYYAAWGETSDDDFVPNPGVITTHFLSKSISFGPNDYYTKFDFDTNIPLWNNQEDADDYFNGLKDITEADNYTYIARQDNAILNPDLPGTDIDELTELGTNGMRYSYGNRLYEISNIELSNLMTELFQPATVQSVIDGNKLFGSNTMEAVSGVIYIPLTSLDAVCDMGALANVKIGSWESQQAQGRRIIKNEGTIDCGSFFYNRVYNDYRDYEPYNLLFANLPFCGCHQLTISKYLDKTVGVSYNIDITTGAIVCKLTADGLLVDIFDGTCGASRPISATDNNAYINNVVGAITGASSQASGAIEGITNTVGVVEKATSVGSVAAGGAALGALGMAGAIGAGGVFTAYQIKNAVDNPPQMHRGSLIGNLAYNLNTKPTFLFYSKRTIRPENELAVVGYPSGHGGTIGTFNGFLSCGAVKLANFNGTKAEESELFEILKGGIYI